MRLRGTRRLAALLVMALALAAPGCGRRESADEGDEAAPVVPVEARVLEMRTFRDVVESPGQWRSANEVAIVAPFAAAVERLDPRVGDRVEKGQTVGELVTRESRAAVRGAELLQRQASDPAARDEAARALALARRDLVRVPVVATASGVVVRRTVEPGAEVAEGGELLALVPQGALVFEAHVPLESARRVKPGQRATVALEGGGALEATVQRLLPSTSAADQSALVWLAPAATPPPGLLDRFGAAKLFTGGARRAVAVPDSAVVEDDLTGETRVARVDRSGVAVWTTVTLGLGEGGWHELRSPALPAGTVVVVSGQHGLPDSTRVRVAR